MRRAWVRTGATIGWIATAACGSDGGSPPPTRTIDAGPPDPGAPPPSSADGGAPGGPLTEDSFAARYCELIGRCCTAVGAQIGPMPCTDFKIVRGRATFVTFDAVLGAECLARLETAVEKVDGCAGLLRPAACFGTFVEAARGSVPTGGTCAEIADCAPRDGGLVHCQLSRDGDGGTTHVCGFIPYGHVDDPCGTTVHGAGYIGINGGELSAAGCRLEHGLFCNPLTRKCAQLLEPGAECTGESRIVSNTSSGYARLRWPCVAEATCDWMTAKKCLPRNPAGEPCDPTLPATCLDSAWCDPAQSKCVRKLEAKSPCTTSAQCISNSCSSAGACSLGIQDVACLPP